MQFGFSIVGLVYLLMLFVPNIMWAKRQPAGYEELAGHENPALLVLERAGEVAASFTVLIFVCPCGFAMPWLLWLVAVVALMVLYEVSWARYFKGGCRLCDMYAPLGPIPVPLASLPVAALFLLGIWYQSWPVVVVAVVLGIGHIGIHLGHLRELSRAK